MFASTNRRRESFRRGSWSTYIQSEDNKPIITEDNKEINKETNQ